MSMIAASLSSNVLSEMPMYVNESAVIMAPGDLPVFYDMVTLLIVILSKLHLRTG